MGLQLRQESMLRLARYRCGRSNRRRHIDRMRESLRIDRQVPLDTRYLLAGVTTIGLRRVRVLHALRIPP